MSLVKPSVMVRKFTLFNGQQFYFKKDDKLIVVGPNNSGKSQFLRDILEILEANNNRSGITVDKIELAKSESLEDFSAYIKKSAELKNENYYLDDWSIHQSHLYCWDLENRLGPSLVNGFVKRIAADDRLNICQQQDSISPGAPCVRIVARFIHY